MIRTFLYRPSTGAIEPGNEDLLAAWQREPDAVIWADVAGNDPLSERQLLVSCFGLHRLAINHQHHVGTVWTAVGITLGKIPIEIDLQCGFQSHIPGPPRGVPKRETFTG